MVHWSNCLASILPSKLLNRVWLNPIYRFFSLHVFPFSPLLCFLGVTSLSDSEFNKMCFHVPNSTFERIVSIRMFAGKEKYERPKRVNLGNLGKNFYLAVPVTARKLNSKHLAETTPNQSSPENVSFNGNQLGLTVKRQQW